MQPRHRFSVFAGLQWTWTPSTHTNYSFFLKFDTRYINFIEKPYLPGKPSWKSYCNLQNLPEPLNQTPTPPHTHLLPLEDWMEHKRSWRKWMIAMKKTTLKLPFEESVLPDSVLQAFAELLVCLHLCGLMSCWVPWVCFCPHGMPRSVSRNASWGFDMWCHWSEAWKQFHGSSSQTGTEYFLSCQDSFRWGGVCTTLV